MGGDTLHSYRDAAVGRLDNFYGPTEVTVLATAGAVAESGAALPAIGRPIPGADVLALDEERRPVPKGWLGELHLAGPGLARGYINDPRRTAEAFTPHPCPRTAGERAYRSGDLGRYRAADGELLFCGRADRQVKLRGFRIEPGEIEQCLRTQPQVREARTLVVGRDEQRRLVCFCTGDLSAEIARDWLRARLPAYMVPAQIHVLDRMPTNANGKIDLGALAARVQGERRRRAAAATPTEEQLLAVWRGVLASDVDVEDEFFASGGNSLLAARLAERIRVATGKDTALVDVLEFQTVRALARALDSRPRAQAPAVQPIVAAPAARFEPFPLTDVQHAYWVGRGGGFELGNVATHIYTESDSDSFDIDLSNEAWNQLIERHDMLRAVFSADGQQRVLPRVPPYRMPVDDLSALDERERDRRLMETRARMSHQVFDPQQWPLFEFRLSILGPNRVRLHGSFDALIADAHSFGLLGREYAQIRAGKRDSLPPLGITFRDYVLAERRLRSGPAYQQAREYWLARVADFPPEPQLPLALDPGRIEQPRFARLRTRLDAPDWTVLKEKVRRLQVTPSVLLLGAYAQVLSKWSGSARFVLNLTLFNRMPVHPDIGNVVGDFTSLTAFEVRSGGRTFAERLVQHQAQLWRDLEHRAFSAVELMRELRRRRGSEPVRMPVVFTSVLPLESGDGDRRATAAAADYSITQTPQVWLDHVVQELDGALLVHWDFVEELFPAGLMPAMFAAYQGLLHDLANDAACWDAPDPMALPATQRTAREVFNETGHPQPAGLRIFDGFLASAQRDPYAVAVISPERTLSYGELHAAAFGMAAQLLAAGVRRGDRVAVMMHKGWEQVVAAIAVTLAGAAYLPIDASLPEARRMQLIAAAGVRVALIQARDLPALALPADLRVFPSSATVHGPASALPEVGERDFAYIIFTSGSTGTPKGVIIDHRGAVNTLLDINRRFALAATDRLLGLSSLSFDLSVWDVFGTLAAGAALVIPAEGEVTNPPRWSQYLRTQGVTVINAVPAFLQMLADFLETQTTRDVGALRWVMLSGDWIPVTLPGRLRALAPACHIKSGWRHGSVDLVDLASDRTGRRAAPQHPVRTAAAQSTPARDERGSRAVPGLGAGHVVHRRRWPGARLLGRSEKDGAVLHSRSGGRGRAHVSHRRLRAPPAGRRARIPRAARRPGQGAGPSHRAGGDRGGAAGPSRRARGRGAAAGQWRRTRALRLRRRHAGISRQHRRGGARRARLSTRDRGGRLGPVRDRRSAGTPAVQVFATRLAPLQRHTRGAAERSARGARGGCRRGRAPAAARPARVERPAERVSRLEPARAAAEVLLSFGGQPVSRSGLSTCGAVVGAGTGSRDLLLSSARECVVP